MMIKQMMLIGLRRLTIASALTLASIAVAHAQSAPNPWEAFEYPEINNFDMPALEIFELENGIRFYLVEDRELPLIDLTVLVRTGGILVPDDKVGL
ncbi:MAG: hypothetical protein Q8L06_21795, partial [Pseudohongiella sp.]|nr:hypothetical protein [Pseudohongiella sp.]